MMSEQDLDRADSQPSPAGRSLFTDLATPRMFNMIALCTAVLWVVGSVGAITSLAGSGGDPATWQYVDAAASAGAYLIVTVLAMAAAALLDAVQHRA